ncbi:hypothetical protein B0H13DRAFT_1880643 [Mycena leptocephala]|nr:hypothetical protein B0H13DRAFT_1880643 [Mycena leptocephala]
MYMIASLALEGDIRVHIAAIAVSMREPNQTQQQIRITLGVRGAEVYIFPIPLDVAFPFTRSSSTLLYKNCKPTRYAICVPTPQFHWGHITKSLCRADTTELRAKSTRGAASTCAPARMYEEGESNAPATSTAVRMDCFERWIACRRRRMCTVLMVDGKDGFDAQGSWGLRRQQNERETQRECWGQRACRAPETDHADMRVHTARVHDALAHARHWR